MNEPTFKSFDSKAMLDNVVGLQKLIQKLRQNEGVGSDADELILHRAIQDLDMLLEMIGGLRLRCDELNRQNKQTMKQLAQLAGSRNHYERMLTIRDERIKQLENDKAPEGDYHGEDTTR